MILWNHLGFPFTSGKIYYYRYSWKILILLLVDLFHCKACSKYRRWNLFHVSMIEIIFSSYYQKCLIGVCCQYCLRSGLACWSFSIHSLSAFPCDFDDPGIRCTRLHIPAGLQPQLTFQWRAPTKHPRVRLLNFLVWKNVPSRRSAVTIDWSSCCG